MVVVITTPEIKLSAFMKLAGAVSSGGAAKALLESGAVKVNGAAETRRGRKLSNGDRVWIEGQQFRVEVQAEGEDRPTQPGQLP